MVVGEQVAVLVHRVYIIHAVVPLLAGVAVHARVDAQAQVMPLEVELLGVVGTSVGEQRVALAARIQCVVKIGCGVGRHAVVAVFLVAQAVVECRVVVVETAGVHAQLRHRVDLVVDIHEYVSIVRTGIRGVVGRLDHRCVVGAVGRGVVVAPHVGMCLRGVVAAAVAPTGENVEAQLLLGPHVAHPRAHEGLVAPVDAETHELVALDVGVGHYVDDRLGVGGVLGRGVGDGLYARQGVGRQGLQVGLEVLLGELRRLVVDPYLDTRHTAQAHIALHVNLHARCVLQGVLGGAGLYAGVLADVVYHLLAVHGVEGLLGADLHGVQRRGAGHHAQRAQGRVVAHAEWHQAVAVAYGRHAQQVAARRHAADLEEAVEVRRGPFDEATVGRVEHGDVDEGEELAADGVAQLAHHLEGVALFHFLLLLHLLGLLAALHLVPVAGHRGPPSGGSAVSRAARWRPPAGASGLGVSIAAHCQNHGRKGCYSQYVA